MFIDLIKSCRSYRRFDASRKITAEELYSIAEAVRYTPSAANLQRLRLLLITDEHECDTVFSSLRFAASLKDWNGPTAEERPVAYAVFLSECELDTTVAIDLGICSEALLLSARERGIGGCIFRSFDKNTLSPIIQEGYNVHEVIALGYPSETVLIEDCTDGDIKYYRDSDDRHVVPKLPMEKIVI